MSLSYLSAFTPAQIQEIPGQFFPNTVYGFGYLLLENGGWLLLESGGGLLLEKPPQWLGTSTGGVVVGGSVTTASLTLPQAANPLLLDYFFRGESLPWIGGVGGTLNFDRYRRGHSYQGLTAPPPATPSSTGGVVVGGTLSAYGTFQTVASGGVIVGGTVSAFLSGGVASVSGGVIAGGSVVATISGGNVGAVSGGVIVGGSIVAVLSVQAALGFPPPFLLLLSRSHVAPVVVNPDLLAAIVRYLRNEPTVANPLTNGMGVQIWTDLAPAKAYPPFVTLHAYTEERPGQTLEDERIPVTVQVVTNSLDQARSLGAILRAAIDTPALSPYSLQRPPLVYKNGVETHVMRNNSRPYRMDGLGKGGLPVYVEDIEYQFYVTPEF